jgi:hypothetical protein
VTERPDTNSAIAELRTCVVATGCWSCAVPRLTRGGVAFGEHERTPVVNSNLYVTAMEPSMLKTFAHVFVSPYSGRS